METTGVIWGYIGVICTLGFVLGFILGLYSILGFILGLYSILGSYIGVYIGVILGLYSILGIMEKKMETTIMENQMEKKMENEMETREYIGVAISTVSEAHSCFCRPYHLASSYM